MWVLRENLTLGKYDNVRCVCVCVCLRAYVYFMFVCVFVCHFIHRQTIHKYTIHNFFSFSFVSTLSVSRFSVFSLVLSFHFYWACQLYVNHRQRRTRIKRKIRKYPIARAEDTFRNIYNSHHTHVYHCFFLFFLKCT